MSCLPAAGEQEEPDHEPALRVAEVREAAHHADQPTRTEGADAAEEQLVEVQQAGDHVASAISTDRASAGTSRPPSSIRSSFPRQLTRLRKHATSQTAAMARSLKGITRISKGRGNDPRRRRLTSASEATFTATRARRRRAPGWWRQRRRS